MVLVAALVAFGVPAFALDNAAYKLGTGDKVRVTVFNEPDLSGDFDVNDRGLLALPLIGNVEVQGKTLSEVQALVTSRYSSEYLVNPRISVEVLNYRPFFIIGEVRNPGSYPYVNGMTVINAIALAGGYTSRAAKDRILLKRTVGNAAREQRVPEDGAVLPGDVITVPERFF
ncbi:MAG: polysaccharide biosynthesis/export family protein [Gemmatimonas sp.]